MKISKIKPYFSNKIWGGKKAIQLGFDTRSEQVGEIWMISAHNSGTSKIVVDGKELDFKNYFENNREKFNNFQGEYPLLNKLLLPNDDLSIQVHPDDEYAKNHHNSLGKPESWYVIDVKDSVNKELIYGHKAKNKEELESKIKEGNIQDVLLWEKVDVGEFLYVPVGKIHAVCKGMVLYEIQRSSDITYRLFDYNRKDDNGNLRELHIKESLDNVSFPDTEKVIIRKPEKNFFNSREFSIYMLDGKIENKVTFNNAHWLQVTVLSEKANINGLEFKKFESAIIYDDSNFEVVISNETKSIVSYLEK